MAALRYKGTFIGNFLRFYSKKIPKNLEKIVETTESVAEPISVKDISDECSRFEKSCMKQVMLEKEQDATLKVEITKECKAVLRNAVSGVGPKHIGGIRMDSIPWDKDKDTDTSWASHNLDFVDVTKKLEECDPAAPTVNKGTQTEVNVTSLTTTGTGSIGATPPPSKPPSFSRPIRQEPGKVIFNFIPQEWWLAFIPKTGVTGFGTFLFAFGTYLISHEKYVLEHYFYHGLGCFGLWALGIKYIGPFVGKYLDKEIDAYEKAWNDGRDQQKEAFGDMVMNELECQLQMEGQRMLIDAKRENVALQLEEEYRKRQMLAYTEVKKRLDYYVEVEQVRQRYQHKNLVDYVTREVVKSITPDMQNKLIYYSIDQIVEDLEKRKK